MEEPHQSTNHWRILVANEERAHLDRITQLALSIGGVVVASEMRIAEVSRIARDELPDVALVGLEESTDHALELIREIAQGGVCPVIAILKDDDERFVEAAAEQGIFAYASELEPKRLTAAIEVALRRFSDSKELEGAMLRRAEIERAKGIIMERYQVDEDKAFELLRKHARSASLRMNEAAARVIGAHRVLPKEG